MDSRGYTDGAGAKANCDGLAEVRVGRVRHDGGASVDGPGSRYRRAVVSRFGTERRRGRRSRSQAPKGCEVDVGSHMKRGLRI